MNYVDRYAREIANFSVQDVLLADVAVRIQLSPTDYQKAVDHYHAINNWLERADSPLHGLLEHFYPQGGFAIGAAIARHDTTAEFDIDVMAQAAWRADIDPEVALSTLHAAIRGEKGSRYFEIVERKTRCSTVNYTYMHLDVTPAVRVAGREERTSLIFHSKPSDTSVPKQRLLANPGGFADWFNAQTPADGAFGAFFEKRSLNSARMIAMEKADAAPVPEQLPAYRKSRAVISLQLIKRWRNIAYDRRHPKLRLPPSVLLAYYVGTNANCTNTLLGELIYQVEQIADTIENAEANMRLIREFNPRCGEDELTDRWPGDRHNQRVFIQELKHFLRQLYRLRQGVPLAEMQKILEDLFGERPARAAVDGYMGQHVRDNDANKGLHIPGRGSVPTLGSVFAPTIARATPKSTPFGD